MGITMLAGRLDRLIVIYLRQDQYRKEQVPRGLVIVFWHGTMVFRINWRLSDRVRGLALDPGAQRTSNQLPGSWATQLLEFWVPYSSGPAAMIFNWTLI